VKVGDLVKHSDIPSLGVGLVMKDYDRLMSVQWIYEADDYRKDPGPTLEAASMLEVINESSVT
jgi:hypothetical protein